MTLEAEALTALAPLRALLAFYEAMGVDAPVGEVPLALADKPAPGGETLRLPPAAPRREEGAPPRAIAAAPRAAAAAGPASALLADAEAVARSSATLGDLARALAAFEGCPLKETAKSLVFADGNPEAGFMLVGEAPGREEDLEGLPFVGRSGKLLDLMLKAIGRDRGSAYITNVLPWRPPGNRPPTLAEVTLCLPFLRRHIELARPRVLVLLGGVAARHLLDTEEGIMRLRGQWRRIEVAGTGVPVLATFHPAYLLRQPASKRLAWIDFLAIAAKLAEDPARPSP